MTREGRPKSPDLTWEGILEGLDRVLELCRSLGLADEVTGSRFLHHHRRRLVALTTAAQGQGPEAALAVYTADREAHAVALGEAAELGRMEPFLRAANPEALTPKLREALRGPVLPSAERPTSNSNRPRNILFELNVASKLWEVGVAPILGGRRPDLRCEVHDTRLLIECKRPLTEEGARTRIRRAWHTLTEEATKAGPGARGVAVLSIGKLIPAERQLVVAANLAAVEGQLYALLKETAAPLKALAKERSAARVIGIHFHVLLPIYVSGTKTLGIAEDTMVSPLSPEGSRDHRTLWLLHDRLLAGKRAQRSPLAAFAGPCKDTRIVLRQLNQDG